jgi:hypothetical protein
MCLFSRFQNSFNLSLILMTSLLKVILALRLLSKKSFLTNSDITLHPPLPTPHPPTKKTNPELLILIYLSHAFHLFLCVLHLSLFNMQLPCCMSLDLGCIHVFCGCASYFKLLVYTRSTPCTNILQIFSINCFN